MLRAEHKTLKTALAMKLFDEQQEKEDKKMEKEKAATKKGLVASPAGPSSKRLVECPAGPSSKRSKRSR